MTFTKKTIAELQEAYDLAVKHKLESFNFYGEELLTAYAKHLLIYLNSIK